MTYFSNATDAEIYQANWCHRCQHFKPADGSLGCPVLNMHFDHNGDYHDSPDWRRVLDEMIPCADGPQWHGECAFFSEVDMKPDRLYTPRQPEHLSLLQKASWELRELAGICEEWAQEELDKDGHEYAKDDPEHVCDENCPSSGGNTSLWLHQMWAVDEADAIDRYLATHPQYVEPVEAEITR